jgi:hypothetical protein
MPKKPQHEFDRYEGVLRDEIDRIATRIANQLPFAKPGGDAEKLTEAENADHIRFNWQNTPGYPAQMLDRYAPADSSGMRPESGMKAYLRDVRAAWPLGYPEPAPVVSAPPATYPQPAQSIGGEGMNLAPVPQTGVA